MNLPYSIKKIFVLPTLALIALSLTGCEAVIVCEAFNGLDANSQSILLDYFPTLTECGTNDISGIVVDGDTVDTTIKGIVVDGAG